MSPQPRGQSRRAAQTTTCPARIRSPRPRNLALANSVLNQLPVRRTGADENDMRIELYQLRCEFNFRPATCNASPSAFIFVNPYSILCSWMSHLNSLARSPS